jgi:glycosyltransferase involved in cell wall biosynthesis
VSPRGDRTAGAHTRVLFLCPMLDNGGAERHWAGLLPALAERGIGVRIVALGSGGRALEELRSSGVPVRELGREGLRSLSRLPALLQERDGAPDVLVTWGYNAHALGAAYCAAARIPHVVNWHRQPDFPMTPIEAGAVRLAGRAGAAAIAVTAAQLPHLARLGFDTARVRVVPNGVPAPADAGDRAALRRALDLPAQAFVAVLVARLRPEKRINDFVAAVAAARGRRGVLGVVVGDGPLEAELRAQAAATGAPVRFAGHQADPSRWMLAADAVCLTSEHEALPMALVEALACGRACVATAVGGTAEIVTDGWNGRLAGIGDVRRLARALDELAADAALTATMGERSLSRWAETFSFEAMAESYSGLLSSVGGRPARWDRR